MTKKAFLIFVAASIVVAGTSRSEDEITLTSSTGEKITGIVSRVEPDGIVITTKTGISKIPFSEMPPEMRSKYGYDSKRAAAFSAVVEQAQRSNIEQQQKVREEAAADALRADEERARLSEEFSKRQAANGKISASEALRNVGFSMQGTVLQRTSEGLLVRSTTAGKGGDFWLVGYDAPEDSRISVKVTVAGTKEYTTVRDAVRMVDMYRFVQQNSPPVPVAP